MVHAVLFVLVWFVFGNSICIGTLFLAPRTNVRRCAAICALGPFGIVAAIEPIRDQFKA